jgi:riboflavin-specific deaminase-like protein
MKKARLSSESLPFVLVNMAMTADGKIATANRASSSFSSTRDHRHLLELRATADAVMAGASTVGAAKINLGPGGKGFRQLRLQRGLAEYNLRIIVSGSGSINPRAAIFKKRFSPIIVMVAKRARARKLARLRGLSGEVKICGRQAVDLRRALAWLRAKWKVRRLLCEGGGELNEALFQAGLVDELHLTICPKIFGGRRAPTIAEGVGFLRLADSSLQQIKSFRRVGDEVFLVFRRPKP